MKYYLLAGLLSLTACGSADTPTANAPAVASPTSSDTRIAQIRTLHQQLLAIQKPLEETEKNPVIAKDKGMPGRHKEFMDMVAASQEMQGTIDQLNPDKSQEPAQAALVGETLRRTQAMVKRANSLVAMNQDWIDYIEKTKKP